MEALLFERVETVANANAIRIPPFHREAGKRRRKALGAKSITGKMDNKKSVGKLQTTGIHKSGCRRTGCETSGK